MNQQNTPQFQGGPGILSDLGLTSLTRKLNARPWILLLFPVFWLIIANALFLVTPKSYRGVLEITPATITSGGSQGGGLSSLLGSSLLGGGLGASSDPIFNLYIESWTSTWLAKEIAHNPALMHEIFAAQWSEKDNNWVRPHGPATAIKGAIKGTLGVHNQWHQPGPDEVKDYLDHHIHVEQTRGSLITKISFEGPNPKLAEMLLRSGHHMISDHLRTVFKVQTQETSSYLGAMLNNVQITDYKEALINQMLVQQKYLMLALSKSEFAAQPLGLNVATSPVSPRPAQILVIGLLLAVASCIVTVFIADRYQWPLKLRDVWERCNKNRVIANDGRRPPH